MKVKNCGENIFELGGEIDLNYEVPPKTKIIFSKDAFIKHIGPSGVIYRIEATGIFYNGSENLQKFTRDEDHNLLLLPLSSSLPASPTEVEGFFPPPKNLEGSHRGQLDLEVEAYSQDSSQVKGSVGALDFPDSSLSGEEAPNACGCAIL